MLRQTRSHRLDDTAVPTALATPTKRFARDERGATMVEYIILVGVVAIVGMAGFKRFGFQVRNKIDQQSVPVSAITDK